MSKDARALGAGAWECCRHIPPPACRPSFPTSRGPDWHSCERARGAATPLPTPACCPATQPQGSDLPRSLPGPFEGTVPFYSRQA